MDATDDQIEAARTKVRNMLHAADHGNHLGEVAVMRMAASEELLEAMSVIAKASERSETMFGGKMSEVTRVFEHITRVSHSAISKAEGSTLMERRV